MDGQTDRQWNDFKGARIIIYIIDVMWQNVEENIPGITNPLASRKTEKHGTQRKISSLI
jgi:hypothetical protein